MARFSEHMRQELIISKGTICANCLFDAKDDIIFHHIVPVIIGGTDNISNIAPLCEECHKKLHGITSQTSQALSHSDLIKKGIEKARQSGITVGRKKTTVEDIPNNFLQYYTLIKSQQKTVSAVAKELHKSRTTIYKYIHILDENNISKV